MGQNVELPLDKIFFDKNDAQITRPGEVEKVKEIAYLIRWQRFFKEPMLNADWAASLEGYASGDEGVIYNSGLAELRANAVLQLLTTLGVPAFRLSAYAMPMGLFGLVPETAKDAKTLQTQRQENRRVDVVLKYNAPSYLHLDPPGTPPRKVDLTLKEDPNPPNPWSRKVPGPRDPNYELLKKVVKKWEDKLNKLHLDPRSTLYKVLGVDPPDDQSSGTGGDN
jgi:hypothetical protein